MATFDVPITPSRVDVLLRSNAASSSSPFNSSTQTVDRGGYRWAGSLIFSSKIGEKRALLMSLIAKLRGQANRLRVYVSDNPKRGSYGGTPLVAGAGQTGSTLNVDGCTANVAGWIKEGDYFSVLVGSEHELKIATLDASSDGIGNVTLTFEPRLRAAPADNAAVIVEDGSLGKPRGIFMLDSNEAGWSSLPGHPSKRSDFTLDIVEDVFSTQS